MRRRQRGVVMFIALITLVVLTLTGLALMRTVDSSVLIAGNMAMKNSALRSGDAGVQAAANWLYLTNANTATALGFNGAGYSAFGLTDDNNTCAGLTWTNCWNALSGSYAPVSLGTDGAGNTVQYLIQRLCNVAIQCSQSPSGPDLTDKDNRQRPNGGGARYYRILVRVSGPRSTVSLIEAVVAP